MSLHKIIITVLLLAPFFKSVNAQDVSDHEKYGKTLNLGAGVGYYGYIGHPVPVGSLNFEFDVARNFTLAPFVGFYAYRTYYYWGDPDKSYQDPSYRQYSYQTITVPAGLKGTYYFDELFHAHSDWDFYAAASAGFIFRSVLWDSDYYGNRNVYKSYSPLYLNAHIGAEYHINKKTGIFLDLSTGVSTFGLALHL